MPESLGGRLDPARATFGPLIRGRPHMPKRFLPSCVHKLFCSTALLTGLTAGSHLLQAALDDQANCSRRFHDAAGAWPGG